MFTVTVSDKYAETLRALGDVQSAIDVAIQRYTIEQITARIHELRQREAAYQKKAVVFASAAKYSSRLQPPKSRSSAGHRDRFLRRCPPFLCCSRCSIVSQYH